MPIPLAALLGGFALHAPEVANNYMGLFKNINSLRDESNAGDALKRIQQFATPDEAQTYQPEGYLSPASRQTLEKLRAEKLDTLLRQGAAAPLAQIRELQTDPRFRDAESVAEIVKDPRQAVFGQDAPDIGGYAPGDTKGTVTAGAGNPYVAQGLAEFQSSNLGKLDRFRAASGDRWAGAGLGKEEANAFKDVATGQKDYAGIDEKAAATVAENTLNGIVANYPLARTTESWNGLVEKLRKVPGLDPKLIDSTLTAIASRNEGSVGAPVTQTVQNGPNSTISKVNLDMFRKPVTGTRVVSSNNPSDREMGLTGGGDGGSGGALEVSWIGPDGTPQSAVVPRGEIATLKSSLKAQGVKEINTVDGKKASRTETLVKPEKGKRSILGDRPGGAPAAGGPDLATAQRLVTKYGTSEAARAAYAKGER